MAILGAALRAELAKASGVQALRRELRVELRTIARKLERLESLMRTRTPSAPVLAPRTPGRDASPALSAAQIRAVRGGLGESRKAFAARLRVSPSIIFAWESGRSTPRRAAIVSRLQSVMAVASTATKVTAPAKTAARPAKRRSPKLSAARKASLKLQGQYMGALRSLAAKQKAQVKALKASKGFAAAIVLAKKLRKA